MQPRKICSASQEQLTTATGTLQDLDRFLMSKPVNNRKNKARKWIRNSNLRNYNYEEGAGAKYGYDAEISSTGCHELL
jgi:hypothetical protein